MRLFSILSLCQPVNCIASSELGVRLEFAGTWSPRQFTKRMLVTHGTNRIAPQCTDSLIAALEEHRQTPTLKLLRTELILSS